MHQREQRRTLVLLSGGLDSSACVHFYQSQRHRVDTLFVNYGQAAVSSERRSARRIAKHYNCDHRELTIDGGVEKSVGVIRGRNALLLLIALLEWEARAGIIAIGIHGGTRYPDCTPDFIRKVQSVFDLYTAGAICAGAPFAQWSKRDVWEYSKQHQIPIALTYSCEAGNRTPCGRCLSCRDRSNLYAL